MKHFVDQAKIKIRAGKGGDGIVSFRHEKYVSKGGPDGGDGGKGGDVYLVADTNIATLLDFQAKRLFVGQDGQRGARRNMTGASGVDIEIAVPVGTLVYENIPEGDDTLNGYLPKAATDPDTMQSEKSLIADLRQNGQKVRIARGGAGGKGNSRFKSSTNRVPREFSPGERGEKKDIQLDLKLMADIGLIGFPNAGKSTLLSVLTNARPEVAGYRFTTLTPNLGVLRVQKRDIIIADIPGLIEGAAEGKGLGDDFLRHVERTRVLVHLIDPTSAAQELGREVTKDVVSLAYKALRGELAAYSDQLLSKPELVVITKIDVPENSKIAQETSGLFERCIAISASTHEGLDILSKELVKLVDSAPEVTFDEEMPVPVFTLEDLKSKQS